MFPISDSIHSGKFPYLNLFLIVVTVFVFVQQLLAPDADAFISQYALIPSHVSFSNFATLIPFLTAIFLHGGFLHILSNMWFLWVFGDDVEASFSPLMFLLLYFMSGVIGNLFQYFLLPTSSIPILGASGAIAGVLGAYFVLFPHAKIKTLVPIFIFLTFIDIPAFFMLGYWFLLQLFSGVGSIHSSASEMGGIAFWAHVGGFIFGIIFAKLFAHTAETGNVIEGEIIS